MKLAAIFQLFLILTGSLGWASSKLKEQSLGDSSDAKIVGSLPYSNQWVSEERGSFLYLTFNQISLANPRMQVNSYTSDFKSSQFYFGSVDYFSSLLSFDRFSLWGRYGLGFGMKQGELQNNTFLYNPTSESAHLIMVLAKMGPVFSYDAFHWIAPYFGIEASPFLFRYSASLSGIEIQGGGVSMGPLIGVHLPLFFDHHGSLYGEIKKSYVLGDARTVFKSDIGFSTGLGYAF